MHKADLTEGRDNDTITTTVRTDRIQKLALGKNGSYIPSSLGNRSISVGRQEGNEMKILHFGNFNSMNSKA